MIQQSEKSKKPHWVDQRDSIQRIVQDALDKGHSFSLWRLPNHDELNLVICETPLLLDDVSLEDSKPGFLIAPFQPGDKKVFLPAEEIFTFQSDRVLRNNEEYELPLHAQAPTRSTHYHYSKPPVQSKATSGEPYLELVQKGIDRIEAGDFEKIVPSRRRFVPLESTEHLIHYFERLCSTYATALISFFSTPYTGTWLGATPELLAKVDAQQWFHTVALAGTQPFVPGTDLRSISWTQKDIEEQALVSRYIINCFKKIRLREFDEHGPKTTLAGNVLHLKTEFKADMAATNFPQLGSVMLKLLHPTSAVCGMPLEKALAFLQQEEGYDRALYAGYLGPIQVQQETQLFVNLRCMQVFQNEAILYAGAGVTIDSIPEKELQETELKMNTLLNVLKA